MGGLGEHKINIQLDQLPKDCKYLSDILIINPKSKTGYSQTDHVVITPYGLFIIETKNYNGEIKGNKNDKYWSVSNRFKMYNPFMQNYGHIKALEQVLSEFKPLTFISMISFTMRCRFSVDPELRKIHSNDLIVYDVELSEFIQRKLLRFKAESPESTLGESQINRIYEIIENANITDPMIRNEHNKKASENKKASTK
ncbi:NERD domain-containing protein [Paenibacillus sp. WQ 127069]|uniref:NERD domain-containing protein n=1 Tax=Paenibacillus baimaensis TaxID=2982185 RepID=A0ABT2UMS8_9BACL|nr:nuclease-related domain-containing protein [Paenibacillus sp. WQ 127069]MCU6795162.1 NERD domain-containing protein [Paenibacillus sp. WQ 127069]